MGAVGAVCGEEWCRKTFPYSIGVEGEHEFDGRAGEQGRDDGVDGAMDVVEGEDMEEVVCWGVFPCFYEGA